jgi:imidazole glycerol-phosphate synthase subunit HisF
LLKKRLIPVLLLKNGLLVRSELFKIHQIIGDPIHEVYRFNQWNVDELIYLDISDDESNVFRRNDHKTKNLNNTLEILEEVSKSCFMPLTWGGKICSIKDMHQRFIRGADKVTINSEAVRNPELISQAARIFGSQAIVVSIDVVRHSNSETEVYINGGSIATGMKPEKWVKEVEHLGAGEILLQSIDRDGTGKGYDLELIHTLTSILSIPLIACSGVGVFEHYAEGIKAGAAAVAAANIWHFKELTDRKGKLALFDAGIDARK